MTVLLRFAVPTYFEQEYIYIFVIYSCFELKEMWSTCSHVK